MFKKKPTPEPRHFTHGSSGALADAAADGTPHHKENTPHAPHSRVVKPLGENETHDQLAEKEEAIGDRKEALLEEGLEESFPASDPVSAHHIT